MRKTFILLFIHLSFFSFSQTTSNQRLSLFVDCSSAYCDINYIKTEVNFVDFSLDNKAADIHLLVTQQSNGGGGRQYQLILFGQHRFAKKADTLRFNTAPNATDFEVREALVKYLQLGLLPFVTQAGGADNITLQVKQKALKQSAKEAVLTKDKWNYWVFNINTNGSKSGEQVYKEVRYNGNLSASRITDKIKISFSINGGINKTNYEYDDGAGGISKYEVKNDNYSFSHQVVKSLSSHWSAGYDLSTSRSTYTNYKLRRVIKPGIEYDIFPYKDVNNKLFTIRYSADVAFNQYIDTTLYNRTSERLYGQGVDVALTYNQKWGTVNISSNYHNYFSNLKYYNIGLGGGVNVRVTGALTFNVFVFGSYQRDQLYLPKGTATEQQILTRQRQLATNYNYFTNFGISYRFGSKVNNFVNPRFNGGNSFYFF